MRNKFITYEKEKFPSNNFIFLFKLPFFFLSCVRKIQRKLVIIAGIETSQSKRKEIYIHKFFHILYCRYFLCGARHVKFCGFLGGISIFSFIVGLKWIWGFFNEFSSSFH